MDGSRRNQEPIVESGRRQRSPFSARWDVSKLGSGRDWNVLRQSVGGQKKGPGGLCHMRLPWLGRFSPDWIGRITVPSASKNGCIGASVDQRLENRLKTQVGPNAFDLTAWCSRKVPERGRFGGGIRTRKGTWRGSSRSAPDLVGRFKVTSGDGVGLSPCCQADQRATGDLGIGEQFWRKIFLLISSCARFANLKDCPTQASLEGIPIPCEDSNRCISSIRVSIRCLIGGETGRRPLGLSARAKSFHSGG